MLRAISAREKANCPSHLSTDCFPLMSSFVPFTMDDATNKRVDLLLFLIGRWDEGGEERGRKVELAIFDWFFVD